MADLKYHLDELDVVRNRADARRAVPDFDCSGWKVLDIGCGIGQTLQADEFRDCAERHGIDIDSSAIGFGSARFSNVSLKVAPAEATGYPSNYFDLVYSRVSVPYTNVPVALREFHRILRPGGHLWITLHSSKMERRVLSDAARKFRLRRLADRGYVALNSLLLQVAGRCAARPWNGTYESLQFPSGISRLLARKGFIEVRIDTTPHFLARARRA